MYNINYTIFKKLKKNLERECRYIYARFHILFLIYYNTPSKKKKTIMQSWELDAYNKRSVNQPRENYTRTLKEIDR